MIGNKHLCALFEYEDEDTSLNQLLEYVKYRDQEFVISLSQEPVDVKQCTSEEIRYLTKAAAIIDYYLQIQDIEVPHWLRSEEFAFEHPYYHSPRLDDFQKLKVLYMSPGPFRARNVFFDLDSIERV